MSAHLSSLSCDFAAPVECLLLAAGGFGGDLLNPSSYLALVLLLGVGAQWLAYKLRIPSILLLLVFGFVLGIWVNPDEILGREKLFAGVSLAVAVILFEGGLTLRLRELKDSGNAVLRLCTLTWVIAWPLSTLAGVAVGLDWRLAMLLGAILVVTGPTVVGPILRSMRPNRRVSALVKWEGIVVDPIGAVLAVLVFQAVLAGGAEAATKAVVLGLLTTLGVGFGMGISLGFFLEVLSRRHSIPDFLHGVVFLAAAVGSFVLSNMLQPESGLLTVTVLGIWLANRKGYTLEHIIEFKEHIRTLLIGVLFIVLAGRVSAQELLEALPMALGFLLLLILLVRPASVFGGLWGVKIPWQEKLLLSFLAPRGIVAAAVTSIFVLEFEHLAQSNERLRGLAEGAENLVPLMFLLIVGTVAIYGLGATPLARRLKLAVSNPQGVLFAGVNSWVIQAAKLLQQSGFQVTIVDSNYEKLVAARMAGLHTVTANILSEYAVEELDFSGLGKMIACTPNDAVNATAAREFQYHFGRANVFALASSQQGSKASSLRQGTAERLSAREAFVPSLSWAEMERRVSRGSMSVKRTRLSENFTLEDFQAIRGEETVILFVEREGKLTVAHPELKLPSKEGALIALVPTESVSGQTGLVSEKNVGLSS